MAEKNTFVKILGLRFGCFCWRN